MFVIWQYIVIQRFTRTNLGILSILIGENPMDVDDVFEKNIQREALFEFISVFYCAKRSRNLNL